VHHKSLKCVTSSINNIIRSLQIRIDDNDGDHEECPDGQVKKVDDGSELDELVDLSDHEKGFTKYLQDGTNGHQVYGSSSKQTLLRVKIRKIVTALKHIKGNHSWHNDVSTKQNRFGTCTDWFHPGCLAFPARTSTSIREPTRTEYSVDMTTKSNWSSLKVNKCPVMVVLSIIMSYFTIIGWNSPNWNGKYIQNDSRLSASLTCPITRGTSSETRFPERLSANEEDGVREEQQTNIDDSLNNKSKTIFIVCKLRDFII
jgi:hypothetical protein